MIVSLDVFNKMGGEGERTKITPGLEHSWIALESGVKQNNGKKKKGRSVTRSQASWLR